MWHGDLQLPGPSVISVSDEEEDWELTRSFCISFTAWFPLHTSAKISVAMTEIIGISDHQACSCQQHAPHDVREKAQRITDLNYAPVAFPIKGLLIPFELVADELETPSIALFIVTYTQVDVSPASVKNLLHLSASHVYPYLRGDQLWLLGPRRQR